MNYNVNKNKEKLKKQVKKFERIEFISSLLLINLFATEKLFVLVVVLGSGKKKSYEKKKRKTRKI